MRRWVIGVPGIGGGRGWGESWDRGGQFTSNRGPRWMDPVTTRRVPSKWKGVERGTKQGQQGEIKARGSAMYNCAL